MKTSEKPMKELQRGYHKTLELALVLSLFVFLIVFQGFPKKFDLEAKIPSTEQVKLEIEEIPMTAQEEMKPPPMRPSVPIPSDDEDIPEDLTIEETELDFTEEPPPPPVFESDIESGYVFVPYDSPPEPIGGFALLMKYVKFPELAKKAGLEGRVVVGILIDETGTGLKTQILQTSGANVGFEAAAQEAAMQMKWKPAKQRDKPVKVWISIPIHFKLKQLGS